MPTHCSRHVRGRLGGQLRPQSRRRAACRPEPAPRRAARPGRRRLAARRGQGAGRVPPHAPGRRDAAAAHLQPHAPRRGWARTSPSSRWRAPAGNNAALVFTRAERRTADQGRAGPVLVRRLPPGLPARTCPSVAQQLAEEQGWVLGIADAPKDAAAAAARQRAAARRGAAHLPRRVRRHLGGLHRRHPPAAHGQPAAVGADVAAAVGRRQPAAAADEAACRARPRWARSTAATRSKRSSSSAGKLFNEGRERVANVFAAQAPPPTTARASKASSTTALPACASSSPRRKAARRRWTTRSR